ncbi:MAG: amidase enhancer [Parcubacteria group bacterium Athens1014_10]|nr:MAG: amidase enhancer [Parcubacteria group bacterium Athens1014_10]TSD05204.1 MAG: amidase enhancer [Parcubacteria group bacterium Athens0714_12]
MKNNYIKKLRKMPFLKKVSNGVKLKNYLILSLALLTLLPVGVKAQNYQAQKTNQSYPYIINLEPGKSFTFWFKFKNSGSNTWYNTGNNMVTIRHRSIINQSAFYHKFWLNGREPAKLSEGSIKPGQEGTFKFALTAPADSGLYWVKLDLMRGEEKIGGGEIEVPIRVLAPTTIVKKTETPAPTENNNSQITSSSAGTYDMPDFDLSEIKEDSNLLNMEEPNVRVGLLHSEKPIKIKANGPYEIRDENNKLLVTQTEGEEIEIVFDFSLERQFLNISGQRILSTDSILRFAPKDENTILEISSYQNSPSWNQNLNDNQFKGVLETHYADPAEGGSGRLWVINELKMEDYLKGLAEAVDVSPFEFLKSLVVAARAYATYHVLEPFKHGIFTVTATEGDQVYRGYGMEKRSPNITKAVDETKGMMVFYNNTLAITPYFSQSDGRTRSWSEVWSGSKPWLVSKPDPYMKGKTMLGHGVGMSSRGALLLGKEYSFGQILKYYYTDIEIKKAY